jgi:uncharacterized protein (UPF0333 family)
MCKRGQSILEYVFLFSVVVATCLTMYIYVRRGAFANLKLTEEQINTFTVDPK